MNSIRPLGAAVLALAMATPLLADTVRRDASTRGVRSGIPPSTTPVVPDLAGAWEPTGAPRLLSRPIDGVVVLPAVPVEPLRLTTAGGAVALLDTSGGTGPRGASPAGFTVLLHIDSELEELRQVQRSASTKSLIVLGETLAVAPAPAAPPQR